MFEEEKRMKEQARREVAEDRMRTEQWSKAGQTEQKTQFNKLLHLVEQSKVCRAPRCPPIGESCRLI
jgi:hypothetical protein